MIWNTLKSTRLKSSVGLINPCGKDFIARYTFPKTSLLEVTFFTFVPSSSSLTKTSTSVSTTESGLSKYTILLYPSGTTPSLPTSIIQIFPFPSGDITFFIKLSVP